MMTDVLISVRFIIIEIRGARRTASILIPAILIQIHEYSPSMRPICEHVNICPLIRIIYQLTQYDYSMNTLLTLLEFD